MIIERRKNAIKGTFFGGVQKIIQIFFPFVIRTIFIYTLGVEYLGLNSLFTSILQVLNLAELGVSSALVFSMYAPIAYDDKEKICQLMSLYRYYYRIIGFVVLALGVALMPFLPHLIKGDVPADINIYILYAMHLSATVLSYWMFAYRNSLFTAHQRNDVISIINIVVNICLYVAQAVLLIRFHNYYIYLSLNIAAQIVTNLIIAVMSKRYYPELEPRGKLPTEEVEKINHKVRDLFTAKIGAVINHSADSIVISAFIGLELLAVYQNYYYIISSIMAFFSIFFSACTAGIGNSLIVDSKEQNRELLYNINHIVFFVTCFCCTCFVSMCQTFMQLWVGEKYELPFSFVILFACYLFAEEAPRTLIVFKDAGGIWKHDRFRPLTSACINLTLNLILTPHFGLYGIIISTIVALIFVSLPWVIVNINNRLFEIGIGLFVRRLLFYVLITAISVSISYFCCQKIVFSDNKINLVTELLIATVVSTGIFLTVFMRTKEQKYMLQLLFRFIHHKP
ncbi:MAG: polysaccharide biosynthesis protein [Lachnospiraceae bacterium]|nr:polysaccharide biosynthesis protein [Lachnospiraceae bacterium]